jgi:hypothetical protein
MPVEHDHHEAAEMVGRALGRIRSITVLQVYLTFSRPTQAPPTEVLGVVIPAGITYGPIFCAELEPAADDMAPFVGLDIGIEWCTDLGHAVTFYTDAVGHFVQVALDAQLPGHIAGFVRRVALDGAS